MIKSLYWTLFLLGSSAAFAVTWDGVGSACGDTLQACIDDTAAGETIYLNTNQVIAEDIAYFKPVSLVAGNGYTPVLSASNGITVVTDGAVTIQGITLLDGKIELRHLGAQDADFKVLNNRITRQDGDDVASFGVFVYQSGTQNNDLDIEIAYNHIESFDSAAVHNGIRIYNDNLNQLDGLVYGNHITMHRGGLALYINSESAGNSAIDVVGNVIKTETDGLQFRNLSSGILDLDLFSNVLYAHSSVGTEGIRLTVPVSGIAGINADIINNSIVGYGVGVYLDDHDMASLNINLYNNILAHNPVFGVVLDLGTASSFNNDHNLYFQSRYYAGFVAGGNSLLNVNPEFINSANARLQPDSPARDAGNSLAVLLAGAVPLVDADGLYRVKHGGGSSAVDIGAFEAGDAYFSAVNNNTPRNAFFFMHPDLNFNSELDNVHITTNYDDDAGWNEDHPGLYLQSHNWWGVMNMGGGFINTGTPFNVLKIGSSSASFRHTTADPFNVSLIDRDGLNDHPDSILQVTNNWDGVSSKNGHPVGVQYVLGRWHIKNLDLATLPNGSRFNVYHQDPSFSAWKHTVSFGTRDGSGSATSFSELNHPLLNNTPCAHIQVTQDAANLNNAHPVRVQYRAVSGRWAIVNEDGFVLPDGALFHVLINPGQIQECNDVIFETGFE